MIPDAHSEEEFRVYFSGMKCRTEYERIGYGLARFPLMRLARLFAKRGRLISAYGASCIGSRSQQQDALLFGDTVIPAAGRNGDASGGEIETWQRSCCLPSVFAVADGMGGCNAGCVASTLCVETIRDGCSQIADDASIECMADAVRDAIERANRRIVEYGNENPGCRGMGTTLVALAVCEDGCRAFNLGDSRAYLFRDGALSRLSKDHTAFQRALDLNLSFAGKGNLSEGGGLTRYLGQGDSTFAAQAYEACFERDSAFVLLCSDGLTKALDDREIESLLVGADDPMACCCGLVSRAASIDESDNVSVLLVKV